MASFNSKAERAWAVIAGSWTTFRPPVRGLRGLKRGLPQLPVGGLGLRKEAARTRRREEGDCAGGGSNKGGDWRPNEDTEDNEGE
jgi:hypothetical protein